MKSLNKGQIILAFFFLAAYFLLLFSSEKIRLLLIKNVKPEYHADLNTYTLPLIIVACASIILLSVKNIQKKVSTSEHQYLDLFECIPNPMAIIDAGTLQFLAVNKSTIDCYKYSEKEFLSMKVKDISMEEEKNQFLYKVKKLHQGIKNTDVRKHKNKNGEVLLMDVTWSEISFKSKKCLLMMACNITEVITAREEKKIAEEEQKRQQNFTKYVMEHFPVDFAVFNKDHQYILLNKIAVKDDEMREWMIGKDDFDYFTLKGADLHIAETRRERFLKAAAGETTEWIDEHIIDGETKYMQRTLLPYFEDGNLKYVYGYGMDITGVKKTQLQKEEYINQLEKIAFTTSHQIRKPICNLQALISLLQLENCKSGETENLISCMKTSVKDMDDYTRDLANNLNVYKLSLCEDMIES